MSTLQNVNFKLWLFLLTTLFISLTTGAYPANTSTITYTSTTPQTLTTAYTNEPTTLEPCYIKGDCNDGYMDKTNGHSNNWECGKNCPGGEYTDDGCNCVCIPISPTCPPTPSPTTDAPTSVLTCNHEINTEYYGADSDRLSFVINQGRINNITSWGISKASNTIYNIQWIGYNQNNAHTLITIGSPDNSAVHNCPSFQLDNDDYINAYRIVYTHFVAVHGLTFYTINNKTYECMPNQTIVNANEIQYNDSGVIRYDHHYLSGFYWYYDSTSIAVKSISLQFTSMNNDESCDTKYILVGLHKTWSEANRFCSDVYDSTLATIITSEDIVIVAEIRNSFHRCSSDKEFESIWIGLTDNDFDSKEGIWVWTDGTSCNYTHSGLCIDDTNWNVGEPNNRDSNEDCGVIENTNTNIVFYNDLNCQDKLMFLCNNPNYMHILRNESNQTLDTIKINTTEITIISTNSSTDENGGEFLQFRDIVLFAAIMMLCIFVGTFVYCYYKWQKNRVEYPFKKKITTDDEFYFYVKMSDVESMLAK